MLLRSGASLALIATLAIAGYGCSASSDSADTTESATTECPDVLDCSFALASDQVFFQLDVSGSLGTVERAIRNYNTYVATPGSGRAKAKTKDDLVDPRGNPIDLSLRLDLQYPKNPAKPVPLVFAINVDPDHRRFEYGQYLDRFARDHGYATAVIDHCYDPVARAWPNVDFGQTDFSMDFENGVKAYTAAVRYFRAHASQFHVDPDAIGGMGWSKGTYGINRLSDPRVDAMSREDSTFPGFPARTIGPQPYPGFSSAITVGYQTEGNGTRDRQYVTSANAPTVLSVGEDDHYGHFQDWPYVVARYQSLDLAFVAIDMPGLPHGLATGFDPALAVDRVALVENAFFHHLEPGRPPEVLYADPPGGAAGAPSSGPFSVVFAPRMDPSTLLDGRGLTVRDHAGNIVAGTWNEARQRTLFWFAPSAPLAAGTYSVVVADTAKSERGAAIAASTTISFAVADPSCAAQTDGLHCSSGVRDGDPGALYGCAAGKLKSVEVSPNGCPSCVGQDDGLYCGDDAVSGDPRKLYRCVGGRLSISQVCAFGCRIADPSSNDACNGAGAASGPAPSCLAGVTSSGLDDGTYCGDAGVNGDASTLYRCANGAISVVRACPNGCRASGGNDACATATGCDGVDVCPPPASFAPSCAGRHDGVYCGDDRVHGDPKTLYRCAAGAVSILQVCPNVCDTNNSGADFCD